jgi:AcrR family transcriptional regulator
MENKREEVESHIIDAATKVFIAKGFKGATMRDIAAEASINLAMLNYYFRSKENLFEIIFEKVSHHIYDTIFTILGSEKPIFEKISDLVNAYINVLIENPQYPAFIFSELSHNPDSLTSKFKSSKGIPKIVIIIKLFQKQIDKEVNAGIMKPVSFLDFFINLESLCTFPFIGKPFIKEIFDLSDLEYGAMLENRKTTVSELLINSLKA